MSAKKQADMNRVVFEGEVTFVVGPEKTATTFIQLLLELHADVTLPQGTKETFFFDQFFDNGLDWYLARFDLTNRGRRLVEVAPSYFCEDAVIERIAAAFPQARIVICARDLVDRTISHHNHMRRYGYIKTSLMESLDPANRPLRVSLYAQFCPKWEAAFGADRISMLDMNVLRADPALFASQVFEVVGVRPIEVPNSVLFARANEGAEPGNFMVARIATTISNKLKQWGFYGLLELARKSPIRRMVFGSKKATANKSVDPVDKAQLARMLAEDYTFLAQRYGIIYSLPEQITDKQSDH